MRRAIVNLQSAISTRGALYSNEVHTVKATNTSKGDQRNEIPPLKVQELVQSEKVILRDLLLMGQRICTQLDILHPDLSARMSENSKLADHTTRCVFLPRDPVMVKDYRNRERPRFKGVIQDRWGLSLAELW